MPGFGTCRSVGEPMQLALPSVAGAAEQPGRRSKCLLSARLARFRGQDNRADRSPPYFSSGVFPARKEYGIAFFEEDNDRHGRSLPNLTIESVLDADDWPGYVPLLKDTSIGECR